MKTMLDIVNEHEAIYLKNIFNEIKEYYEIDKDKFDKEMREDLYFKYCFKDIFALYLEYGYIEDLTLDKIVDIIELKDTILDNYNDFNIQNMKITSTINDVLFEYLEPILKEKGASK